MEVFLFFCFFEGQYVYFSLFSVPLVWYLRHHLWIQGHGDVQLCFLLQFYSLAPKFRPWFILHYLLFIVWDQVHPQDLAHEVQVLQCNLFFAQCLGLALLSEIKWKLKREFIFGFSFPVLIPWAVCLHECSNTHFARQFWLFVIPWISIWILGCFSQFWREETPRPNRNEMKLHIDLSSIVIWILFSILIFIHGLFSNYLGPL